MMDLMKELQTYFVNFLFNDLSIAICNLHPDIIVRCVRRLSVAFLVLSVKIPALQIEQ